MRGAGDEMQGERDPGSGTAAGRYKAIELPVRLKRYIKGSIVALNAANSGV
jgi:hypothetical protein